MAGWQFDTVEQAGREASMDWSMQAWHVAAAHSIQGPRSAYRPNMAFSYICVPILGTGPIAVSSHHPQISSDYFKYLSCRSPHPSRIPLADNLLDPPSSRHQSPKIPGATKAIDISHACHAIRDEWKEGTARREADG